MSKDLAIEGSLGKKRNAVEVGEGNLGMTDRKVGWILERVVGADRAE